MNTSLKIKLSQRKRSILIVIMYIYLIQLSGTNMAIVYNYIAICAKTVYCSIAFVQTVHILILQLYLLTLNPSNSKVSI